MPASRPSLWLRDEPKPGERRAALTPTAVATLIRAGFPVAVERSVARAFEASEYAALGAQLVDSGSWRNAPHDALVIGLKELDASLGPFTHRHVHFAHAFKRQQGWATLLDAFARGGGRLFDLEYLVDEHGRRVAAFGYWAGYVGAALGVLALADTNDGSQPLRGALAAWQDRDELLRDVRAGLARWAAAVGGEEPAGPGSGTREPGSPPGALVFGALGRSGRGATDLLRAVGIEPVAWDREETESGGPFEAVLQHDLVINCVFVAEPVPPFTTLEHLARPQRRTRIIVDVSCDPFGEANVLPIYARPTTLDRPAVRLLGASAGPALHLIAIDHLPALLPRESSEDFCAQLLPTLLDLHDDRDFLHGPFARAATVFERESAAAAERGAAGQGA